MTARELIAALSYMNGDLPVYVEADESLLPLKDLVGVEGSGCFEGMIVLNGGAKS
jgi:hypothetical protein